MASDSIWGPKSINVAQDSRTLQFRFMIPDSDGLMELPTAGGLALSVLQDTPVAAGEPGQFCRPGDITRIVTAGALAAGALVASDVNGKAVEAESGDQILGITLDEAPVAGIIRMVFQPSGRL